MKRRRTLDFREWWNIFGRFCFGFFCIYAVCLDLIRFYVFRFLSLFVAEGRFCLFTNGWVVVLVSLRNVCLRWEAISVFFSICLFRESEIYVFMLMMDLVSFGKLYRNVMMMMLTFDNFVLLILCLLLSALLQFVVEFVFAYGFFQLKFHVL